MPQYVPARKLYFNVAVLLDPEGEAAGVYRKRNLPYGVSKVGIGASVTAL